MSSSESPESQASLTSCNGIESTLQHVDRLIFVNVRKFPCQCQWSADKISFDTSGSRQPSVTHSTICRKDQAACPIRLAPICQRSRGFGRRSTGPGPRLDRNAVLFQVGPCTSVMTAVRLASVCTTFVYPNSSDALSQCRFPNLWDSTSIPHILLLRMVQIPQGGGQLIL